MENIRIKLQKFLKKDPRIAGLLVAIAVTIIIFTLINPNFLSVRNSLALVRAMSSVGIMSLGLALTIIIGDLDLSIGAVYGATSMLVGIMWLNGMHFIPSLLLGLLFAMFVGFINASLTAITGIPSFVVTLGTLNLVNGFTLLLSNARGINPRYHVPPPPDSELEIFRILGATKFFDIIPIQIIWLAVVSIIFWVLLHKGIFGFRLLAIGGSPEAAEIAKLPVKRYKYYAFMLSSLLAGLAGMLDFSYLGATDPSAGLALLFPCFAAVIVGGASLTGGKGTVPGTLVGALLLATLGNGLSVIGVGSFAKLMFVGAATIGAVALDRVTDRKDNL